MLNLTSAARILIIAPHPDDEALGCGGLVQHALAAGASVRVLFVTDGDNNPWPQRVAERRLRITPARRAAWGERRRGEALQSIARLGLRTTDVVFAGLPDQGLTHDLLTGDIRFSDLLRRQANQFSPTAIVGPSLGDSHPDHSAIAVITRLTLPDVPLLEYAIHGHQAGGVSIRLDRDQINTKRLAIACHRTQTMLSKRRFLAYATDCERFIPADDHDDSPHAVRAITRDDTGWRIRLRRPHPLRQLGRSRLDLLGLENGQIVFRRRVMLASRAPVYDLTSGDTVASGCLAGRNLHLPIHALPRAATMLAKRTLSLGFFDEAGWRFVEVTAPAAITRAPELATASP